MVGHSGQEDTHRRVVIGFSPEARTDEDDTAVVVHYQSVNGHVHRVGVVTA